jgi:NADH-quinone oxidoreductase subunit A
MKDAFLPVLVHGLIAAGFAGAVLGISVLVGRVGRRTPTKDMAYECGMIPVGPVQPRFSVKFYLVAMLFILFDVELVFFFPWAAAYTSLIKESLAPLWSMLGFAGILLVGYFYALRKGAFDWAK